MITRRQLNQLLAQAPLWLGLYGTGSLSSTQSTNQLPKIGMGTWITFDHDPATVDLDRFFEILTIFFNSGGRMIDSSPMYGSAQKLLGKVLPMIDKPEVFAATKVWIPGKQFGIEQMQQSIELWGVKPMDLMYVHNLLDWQNHLPSIRQLQAEGRIKYNGVTTSHGRRHAELQTIMSTEPLDYVQFTYNIHDREAEKNLLPLAAEKGIKVVINRPFQGGGLFTRVSGKALPEWASEIQCNTWSQFFLKFIISHPAVTCAIPATSRPEHMRENMQALKGDLPDAKMRQEMIRYFNS